MAAHAEGGSEGVLRIGEHSIDVDVLDDENNTRVLTQRGFLAAMGRLAYSRAGGNGLAN